MEALPLSNGGGVKAVTRILFLVSGVIMIAMAVPLFMSTAQIFFPEGEDPVTPIAFFPLAIVGLIAILTGLTIRTKMLVVANWIGLKLLAAAAIYMAFQAFLDPATLHDSVAGLPVAWEVSQYWMYVWVFVAVIQLYQVAIDIAEHRLIDSYILSKSLLRVVFLLVFLPVYFHMGWFSLDDYTGYNLNIFRLTGSFSYFFIVFMLIRTKAENGGTAKVIIYSLLCFPAFALYAFVLQLLWMNISVIFTMGILPLIMYGFVMLKCVGRWVSHEHKVIGNYVCMWCDTEDKGYYGFCSTDCQTTANEDVHGNCGCGAPVTRTRLQLKRGIGFNCSKCIQISILNARLSSLNSEIASLNRQIKGY